MKGTFIKNGGMNMVIKHGNYLDYFKTIETPDNTELIIVDVITGDEVVSVFYRDINEKIKRKVFDCGGRITDYHDGTYEIDPKNKEEFEKWDNRTSVYGYLDSLDLDCES